MNKSSVQFLAISDFGVINDTVRSLARGMSDYILRNNLKIDSILGLGDNFYPHGPMSKLDKMFKKTWRDIFLVHPALRVPWRMTLGNHDYMGNPQAQIDYHYDTTLNADQLWYLPASSYSLKLDAPTSSEFPDDAFDIEFFCIDTNGCQGHVRQSHPDSVQATAYSIAELKQKLAVSTARWKIVMGHHPCYNQGLGHAACCLRLKDREYHITDRNGDLQKRPGYGLEQVLVEERADAYFCGHEHVFQYHHSNNVHHFCCGASGAEMRRDPGGFYGGPNPNIRVDWVGRSNEIGFVACEVSATELVVKFMSIDSVTCYKEIRICK